MSADVSARLAWPDDARAIAEIQSATWISRFGAQLTPDVVAAIDPQEMAERWSQTITAPQDARFRVLVAVERATVRGFALVRPCLDPDADPIRDGEVDEFAISASHRGLGHGSRLIHACVDTLRADGFSRAVWWVEPDNDELRAFLLASGWEPDGAHRALEAEDGSSIKQVRLHCSIES